jgi:hypothetical protein
MSMACENPIVKARNPDLIPSCPSHAIPVIPKKTYKDIRYTALVSAEEKKKSQPKCFSLLLGFLFH